MQKIFTRYLWYVAVVALIAILLLNYVLQTKNAQTRMVESSELKLGQVAQTVESNNAELDNLMESLSEDYLTRAHAFAYIVEKNPEVLESLSSLNHVRELLNVDELHVIDENGILCAGTIPKYYGMDFATTHQTKEFLAILEDPSIELVQDIQPNGAEKKIFQYIGVARQDKPGIVQVGLAPTRLMEAQKKNELSYIFSRFPMDAGSSLFAVDKNTGIILAHTKEDLVGKPVEDMGFQEDYLDRYTDGGFLTYEGEKKYYLLRETGGVILGIGQASGALYAERTEQIYLVILYLSIVFFFVIYVIHRLLQEEIVDGIHRITRDLSEITRGNLDTVVKVENNPEFKELSRGINKMVVSLTEASGKVSKIVNMVDAPIGVFEYNTDSDEVMLTDRVRQILMWEEDESASFGDKRRFLEMLERVMRKPEPEESEVYKLSDDPERWVKIHTASDGAGICGVVTDVTADMQEKRKIKHERDYDALTGLSNLTRFRRDVEPLLLHPEGLKTAAMVMLDLDHFKSINDQFGHDWGDVYLRYTSRLLSEFDGERGYAARRSGDEFCLFLYQYDSRKEIRDAMEKFYERVALGALTFPDRSRRSVGISAGLAWADGGFLQYDELLKASDEALYEAKNAGRGKMREYTERSSAV